MSVDKKVLIIGGTQMIGRNFVEYCLANRRNYDVHLANRNISNPNLFNCKQIIIDRNSIEQCKSLSRYGEFDIVVDFSCYNSHQLYNVLSNLKYKKYYIISTTATTQDFVLKDKSSPMYNYANDKLALENYINSTTLKDRICIVRPCIVYGQHDYTNRFYERDGNFYHKHNNQIVKNDSNYIYVQDLTVTLLRNIDIEKSGTITITGDNYYAIHPQESRHIDKKKFNKPFNHIIIDNLFDDTTYQEVCNIFPSLIKDTVPYKDLPDATSNYEGIIAALDLKQLSGCLSFFASKYLQNFVEKEFDIQTNKFIAPSAHFHPPPSENGFIHRDYNICSFIDKDTEFVTTGETIYTDDTNNNPKSTKATRSVALLYYLNNKDDIYSFGGGTGIYDEHYNLIKTIEPKNNRLFIFEMTSNSYHGFIGANFPRSCIVSWFHSSPAYMAYRHADIGGVELIERWVKNPEEYWHITDDPEYDKYFKKGGVKVSTDK